jgi:hypothetical protein
MKIYQQELKKIQSACRGIKKAPDESGTLIFGWVSKYQEINFPTQY